MRKSYLVLKRKLFVYIFVSSTFLAFVVGFRLYPFNSFESVFAKVREFSFINFFFLTVVMLLLIAILSLVRLILCKNAGLHLVDQGIYDNSSVLSIGLIPLSEIRSVREYVAPNMDGVLIELKDDRWLLNKGIKRRLCYYAVNYSKGYCVPVTLLNGDFEEIMSSVDEHIRYLRMKQLRVIR